MTPTNGYENIVFKILLLKLLYTKTCVKRPLKKDKIKVLMTNGILMKVESMQNAPLGAFCNTFDLHKAIIGLENLFSVILRVTLLHRLYCLCTIIV